MKTETASVAAVEKWLDGLQQEIAQVRSQLAPLLEEEQRLLEREGLLRSLLASLGGSVDSEPRVSASPPTQPTAASNGQQPPAAGSVRQQVIDRAAEILREAGSPLHINDLHARFLSHGYPVPGAGRPANLTAHLGRSDVIVSPKRGIYGLVDQVGRVARRKPRKKGRTKARSRKR